MGNKKTLFSGHHVVHDEYEEKIKKRAQQKKLILLFVSLVCIIGLIVFAVWYQVRTFSSYEVVRTLEEKADGDSTYLRFGNGAYILRVNGDGMTCFNKKGEVWNRGYDKERLSRDLCGNYVAVGEIGGSKIHIANTENSTEGTVDTTNRIVKVEVADLGVVAAITEDSESNYIEVLDKEGKRLVTGRTVLDGQGYPIDISLSSDGTRLVVSYIHVSGGTTQSKLVFYNFSEVGKNEVDRMVGVYNNFDDMIVPMVEFISTDAVVAVADQCLTFYEMTERPTELERVAIEGEIDQVVTSDAYVAVLCGDREQVYVYNKKGKMVSNLTFDEKVDSISLAEKRVLVKQGARNRLVTFSGREVLNYEFTNGRTDLIPMKGNHFILLSNDGVEEIRLR